MWRLTWDASRLHDPLPRLLQLWCLDPSSWHLPVPNRIPTTMHNTSFYMMVGFSFTDLHTGPSFHALTIAGFDPSYFPVMWCMHALSLWLKADYYLHIWIDLTHEYWDHTFAVWPPSWLWIWLPANFTYCQPSGQPIHKYDMIKAVPVWYTYLIMDWSFSQRIALAW